MKGAVNMVPVDEPASRTGLGKWKPRQVREVRLMFPASFTDLHEPRGDPVQGPFNESRHLQPGGHTYPHADGHPTMGEALSSLSLSLLPVHSKWGSTRAEWGTPLWSAALLPEGDGGELGTHERQLKVYPTMRKPHSLKEGIALLRELTKCTLGINYMLFC